MHAGLPACPQVFFHVVAKSAGAAAALLKCDDFLNTSKKKNACGGSAESNRIFCDPFLYTVYMNDFLLLIK